MEFQEVLRRRRMVRNFADRPLPEHLVDRLIDNGLRGPSAGFTQGRELLVLHGRDETARYWDASLPSEARATFRWSGLLRAPLVIVAFAHKQAYLDRYAEPDKGWADKDESRWTVPYWHVDAAFASLLILLTAVDSGLGGLFFRVFRPESVRAAFDVPAGYEPTGAMAVGYPLPDEASRSLARGHRPAAAVVHRGRW